MKKTTMDSINQGFNTLGIIASPAPKDYSPERYGEYLMSMYPKESGVSFFSSTNYIPASEDVNVGYVKC